MPQSVNGTHLYEKGCAFPGYPNDLSLYTSQGAVNNNHLHPLPDLNGHEVAQILAKGVH